MRAVHKHMRLAALGLLVSAASASAQGLAPAPSTTSVTPGTPSAAKVAPIAAGPMTVPMAATGTTRAVRGGTITLEAGTGQVVVLGAGAASVFAADPKVAEVRPASPTSLFIFGVGPGRTTIAALDAQGAPVAQYEVTVRVSSYGAAEARAAIARALPGANIRIEQRPSGLAIAGEVLTPTDADRVMQLARSYVAPDQQVENKLTVLGTLQVNLRVKVAEMNRNLTRELGINWNTTLNNVGARLGYFGAFTTNNVLTDLTQQAANIAVGLGGKGAQVDGVISALAQDQMIRVLAEPNLTAISGETASFLVGGEFPIPVGQQNGTITVEFKPYGVSLAFVPTVSSAGRISLKVRPEVSQITSVGAVTVGVGNNAISVPALSVRRAETTVELGSGQSFAIAGLLQDSVRETGNYLPLIGDIPILGALFRSESFVRNETELVIIITPYVVRPVSDPGALRTPADGYRAPNDLERILLFRQLGRAPAAIPTAARVTRIPGDAGFVIQ